MIGAGSADELPPGSDNSTFSVEMWSQNQIKSSEMDSGIISINWIPFNKLACHINAWG